MESIQIVQLIEKLHWSNSQYEIDQAIGDLIKVDGERMKMLIMPSDNKAVWENSALVLKKIGYPRVKNVLNEIMICLQDLNWPGSQTIIELLTTIDKPILIEVIENTLIDALKKCDEIWIGGIKVLVKKKKITAKDFTTPELFNLIETNDVYL